MTDLGMAVRVEFCGTEADENAADASFWHFFGEAEIIQVNEDVNRQ